MTKQPSKLSFPKSYFLHSREYPLTSSMILGLKSACLKQAAGISFGPQDIKKSTSLIRRGLLISKVIQLNKKTEISWLVTPDAIELLRDLGIHDKC